MTLEKLRKEIDSIDREFIRLLQKRFKIAGEIARIKKNTGIKIEDNAREKAIIENCKASAKGMDKKFVEKLMRLIILQSKKVQKGKK